MARNEIVTYTITDDIDGTPLPEEHESTRFEFNGAMFNIDLSEANAAKLAELLAEIQAKSAALEAQITALRAEHNAACAEMILPFMQNGRRVEILQPKSKTAKGRKAAPVKRTGSASDDKAVRGLMRYWAEQHIAGLSDRGRIPAAIMDAYHNGKDLAALKAYADANGLIWKMAAKPVSAPPAVFAEPTPAAKPEAIAEPPAATEAPAAKPAAKGRKAPATV